MVEVGSLFDISRRGDAADLEWRIPRSETEVLESGWSLSSPRIYFAGSRFRLVIRRDYQISGRNPLELTLCQHLVESSPFPPFRYWLGVVKGDDGREEEEIGRGRREPGDSGAISHAWLPFPELRRWMGCSAPHSGTLSFILRLRTGPETDDELKSLVESEEAASSCEATAKEFTETDIKDPETGGATNSATRRQETSHRDSEDTLLLKKHLRKFRSSDDRDVLLKVKDKEFRAHKSFLRARSPVFEAMFGHDMRENEEDSVTIEDVDPECFDAFLEYIYTGEVEDLSPTNAMGLHYAADKYDFPSLKRRCVDVLKASLSISLVCEVITLASTHGEEELLETAMAYFTEHQDEVMETVEWQRFTLSNPIGASEVCLAAVKRYRASHK